MLRSAGNRIDGRGVGMAINHRIETTLVRITFDSCRNDPIEGSQRLRAITRHGKPNYSDLNSVVAEAIRHQLRELYCELAPFGSIYSIEFVAIGHRGEDIYIVEQEHGTRHWRIMLDSRK